MKTLKITLLVAMTLFATNTFAQFTNTYSRATSSAKSSDGWNSIWLGYNMYTIKNDNSDEKDQKGKGVSLGISHAFPLSENTPLYLEAGIGGQYNFNENNVKDTYNDIESSATVTEEVKSTIDFYSAIVPVRLLYKFELPNSSITLMPFVGATCRINIAGTGEFKISYVVETGGMTYSNSDASKVDLFNKSDMEEYVWNRLQVGWQIGVKASVSDKYWLGVAYGNDLGEISKGHKLQTVSFALGISF